jgi:hypothetical protein
MQHDSGLIATLMKLPIFQAEWVLWLLIALSLASVTVMVERFLSTGATPSTSRGSAPSCAGCSTKAT